MLTTERLHIIEATAESVSAEISDRQELGKLLGARVPQDWPPAMMVDALPWFREQISENPGAAGWYHWYAVLVDTGGSGPVLTGSGGFKGPPDSRGMVEIGYSVLPAYQNRKIAREMVRALVDWAFSSGKVSGIVAETTEDNAASCAVLRRAGFRVTGEGNGREGIRFQLNREEHSVFTEAVAADLGRILELQKRAFLGEAVIYGACSVPPLTQTIEDMNGEFRSKVFLKAVAGDKIVGSVRAFEKDGVCHIEKLIVDPEFQNRGIGTRLMVEVEKRFSRAKRFELVTGHKSEKNIHVYAKLGYVIIGQEKKTETLDFVYMAKKRKI